MLGSFDTVAGLVTCKPRKALTKHVFLAILLVLALTAFSVYWAIFARFSLAAFDLPQGSQCLAGAQGSIDQIGTLVSDWASCSKPEDRQSLLNFNRIYLYNQRSGGLKIPDTLKDKVIGWLGNREELYSNVQWQTITSVFNKYTGENTVYNPLRGLRPGANDGVAVEQYLDELTKTSAVGCDFCDYERMTAQDVFEGSRIESQYAVTASNVFKYDAYHSLVIAKKHDPVRLVREEFKDMMHTALRWFDAVHRHSPVSRYPHLMWDLLPKASASQVHPHIQVSLAPDRYYGMGESLLMQARHYARDTWGRNYFSDLIGAHSILGLTCSHGDAVAVAYLTPKKEKEVMVWASEPGEDFIDLLFNVVSGLRSQWSVYALSLAVFLPEMGHSRTGISLPAIARVIDRGVPTGQRSDISAMELFAASNVNADPFELMSTLRPIICPAK